MGLRLSMMGLKSTLAHSTRSPHICSQFIAVCRAPAFFFQLHGTQIVVRRPRLREMMQQQMQATSTTPSQEPTTGEAPPKQVATALDRLTQSARLIANVCLGTDRILEALFVASQTHQTTKPLHFFSKEDASMRQHLQDLRSRSLGRLLEETGVINESLRSRLNSWGLHMPVVCPDGAVVAYAWKRQLAGQAGVSAFDRTRLGNFPLQMMFGRYKDSFERGKNHSEAYHIGCFSEEHSQAHQSTVIK